MTMIPLYRLAQWTSGGTMRIVYMVAAVLLVAAFAFGPRRLLRAMPVVLLAGGILASVVASRFVVHEAQAQQRTFLGDDPSWVDHAVPDKRFRLPLRRRAVLAGVWETLFWNDHIDRVYDLGDAGAGPPAAGGRDGRRRRAPALRRRGRAPEVRGRLDVDRARRRAQGPRSRSRA